MASVITFSENKKIKKVMGDNQKGKTKKSVQKPILYFFW
jgi:hypothetical protein